MDTNEVITNDEVIEATEEIATASLSKGAKIGVGVGLAVLIGGIAYKYVAKPMIAKIKAKKEQQVIDAKFQDHDSDDEGESCINE